MAHLWGQVPHFSDLSVGGLWPINMSWHRRRSFLHLPPSCLRPINMSWIIALALLLSHAHAPPSSGSESTVLLAKMPVTLVAADDWRPSSMTERRLLELEREGLLRRRTSLSSPEWIATPAGHREPQPPEGYVVSFAKFHRHGLGAPPSRFMQALCLHYGWSSSISPRTPSPSRRSSPQCARATSG